LIVVLLLGVIGTSIGLVVADAARRRAEAAEENERNERHKVDAARRAAELTSASLQVDLDLAAVRDDSRLGLLRLARTLKELPADAKELREFAAVSVLVVGQQFAPLLPPISHDGHGVVAHQFSPDGLAMLTLGADHTARLWDTRSARLIAVLRHGAERVVDCALSSDGKTAVTDSEDGVLRFWDVPRGTFRASSEPRPDRYGKYWLSNERDKLLGTLRVTADRVLTKRYPGENRRDWGTDGPFELWDTNTGRWIAQLGKHPGTGGCRFENEGRWITGVESPSTVIVFSAADGREIARLLHRDLGPNEHVHAAFSPTGRWIVTQVVTEIGVGPARNYFFERKHRFYTWESGAWQRLPGALAIEIQDNVSVGELQNDVIVIADSAKAIVYQPGRSEPLVRLDGDFVDERSRSGALHDGYGRLFDISAAHRVASAGTGRLRDDYGRLFDVSTGRRLLPPPGRRFHPDLGLFAADSRFIGLRSGNDYVTQLVDTRTDKSLEHLEDRVCWPTGLSRLTGDGQFGLSWTSSGDGRSIFIIPTTSPEIAPDLLILWTQVAVRGEIGPDGDFAPWDEATWERNRQELAAHPTVSPNFPFPGHVSADRLHWLRGKFHETEGTAARLLLAEELVRRSEFMGDRTEAALWRRLLARLRPPPIENGPPPRELK
jgi:hypothetical protein